MNSIRTHASHGADSSVASRALPVAFAALLGVFPDLRRRIFPCQCVPQCGS